MTDALLRLVGRLDRGIAPRVLAVLAVVGLLAPSAMRYVGPDGSAWFPGHGHIFLSGEAALQPHAHPWELPTGSDASSDASSDARAGEDGVLFTIGDLGAASSLASLALPAGVLLLAVGWLTHPIEPRSLHASGWSRPPLVPPPQG